jgi:hypothetical protein
MAPEECSAEMTKTGSKNSFAHPHKSFPRLLGTTLTVFLIATMMLWQNLSAVSAGGQKYTSSYPNTSQNAGDKTTASTLRYVGINYLTLYHMYDTPTQTLERDFAVFKNDGINTIVITMFWYRLESSQGSYNRQFINNVIRVCNIASKYGLQVMIDFHTLVGDGDTWCNPSYVGVGMKLITDPEIASAYVSMVKWAVTQLKNVKNMWAYSTLNEPWYWPLDAWRKTNWINLAAELYKVVKSVTEKPVTIRFVGALFERDWAWDSKLMSAIDFISLNAYVDETGTYPGSWTSFDNYRAGLAAIGQKAAALGKKIQITEFGSDLSDDTAQSNRYRAYTDVFKMIPQLDGWLSWGWDCGYDRNNPLFTQIGSFSIVVQATGSVRPAYYVLARNL